VHVTLFNTFVLTQVETNCQQ